MSQTTTARTERIEIRAKREVKSIIERAAQLRHTTISAYLLETALQKAKSDLRETETLILNEDDRDRFFAVLSTAPRPNAALRALFQKDQV
jgi:uncharacterized protein (DUF1778 family)